MTTWIQLTLLVDPSMVELLSDDLTEYGALSVSLEDAGDQPLFQVSPQDMPFWDRIKVRALFSASEYSQSDLEKIAQDCHLEYTISEVVPENWVRKTQENFPPQSFGDRLWVIPSWCDARGYTGAVVRIDPGLAFGTGTHPTTQLCLEWLAEHRPLNLNVMDYGCGSGILSLAALALGAKTVMAVDHDEQALEATAHNARLNPEWSARLSMTLRVEKIIEKSTLLVANLLAEPLLDLIDMFKMVTHPQATFVLSGILSTEIHRIIDAYAPFCKARSVTVKDEWARLVLERYE